MIEYITWHWREHPIGFPLDPKDQDFEDPRTPPYVNLTLEYQKEDVRLLQAVMVQGTRKELSQETREKMESLLINWLIEKLGENVDAT